MTVQRPPSVTRRLPRTRRGRGPDAASSCPRCATIVRQDVEGPGPRTVAAADAERRRLERDLHDGAQQRLVTLSLQLRLVAMRLGPDSDVTPMLDAARAELAASLTELRELARGLHPAVLSTHGLPEALVSLAARAPLPVRLTVADGRRLPAPVEIAVYYLVSEALTNVAKYAEATSATVAVRRERDRLVVEIADDGVGGADPGRGTGLLGLEDRVMALRGQLHISSPPAGGTVIRAEIPCELGGVTRSGSGMRGGP